jgi:hypothetical protein
VLSFPVVVCLRRWLGQPRIVNQNPPHVDDGLAVNIDLKASLPAFRGNTGDLFLQADI